jgi:DNA polymerase III epsilon subunit-like protein
MGTHPKAVIFIDTETTDLDPEKGEIIEYTFAEWIDGVRGRHLTRKVMPVGPVSPKAAEINGYTREAWEAAGAQPWSSEDNGNVFNFIPAKEEGTRGEGRVIVGGHNTRFDLDFLNWQIKKQGHRQALDYSHRLIDTMTGAAPLMGLGELTSVSLVNVARYFGIDTSLAHSSAGDVEMTIQVWEYLLLLTDAGLRSLRADKVI